MERKRMSHQETLKIMEKHLDDMLREKILYMSPLHIAQALAQYSANILDMWGKMDDLEDKKDEQKNP